MTYKISEGPNLAVTKPQTLKSKVLHRKCLGYGSHSKIEEVAQRPQSSSFWGLPFRILNMNLQKELLWGLWVVRHTKNPHEESDPNCRTGYGYECLAAKRHYQHHSLT